MTSAPGPGPDLFAWAQERRDAGMGVAADAEDRDQPQFTETAYLTICRIAAVAAELHVDDVLGRCPLKPRHPNAWGAVWLRAVREKVIEHTGRVRPCRSDVKKNAHQYPVYRSLIYRSGP